MPITEIQVCNCCRNRVTDGSSVMIHNTDTVEILCEDCHTDLHTHCDRCETAVRRSSCTIINNESIYCQECVETYTSTCADCEHRCIGNTLRLILDRPVCTSCASNYRRCSNCRCYLAFGRTNRPSDIMSCDCDRVYCPGCYPSRTCCRKASIADHSAALVSRGHDAITDYHPRFDWTFHSHKTDMHSRNDPYFGIELEIEGDWPDEASNSDRGTQTFSTADYPLNKAAKLIGKSLPAVAFCSHDGSLENGMEIVTVPHKRQAFKKLKMSQVLKALEEAKCTSEVGARCGMHIHIEKTPWLKSTRKFERIQNRTTLRGKYQNVQYNYDIYQMFFNLLAEDIFKLSRRLKKQVDRYCAFRRSESDKYVAVNIASKKTVEVRVWRGTLNPMYFHAYMQFTFAVLDYIQQYSPVKILKAVALVQGNSSKFLASKAALTQSFHDFLAQSNEYHILVKRLKELELFGFTKDKKKRKRTKQNVCNSRKTDGHQDRPRNCGEDVGFEF